MAKETFASKCEAISSIINGSATKSKVHFPRKYYVEENDDGTRLLLWDRYGNDVLSYAKNNALVSDIINLGATYKRFEFSNAQATDAAKYIVSRLDPLKEKPDLLRYKSEDGLCFNRIPFDPDYDDMKCQLFLELMSRTTNCEALVAFIGSLFIPHCDKTQYVWIYGDGMNGKGTLVRLLQKILGGCYASQETPAIGDRFWSSGILGKRLVAFADCKSTSFPSSGFFRSLTGNDLIRVEYKHGGVYSKFLDAKFMFLSNDMPVLEANKADLRRAIFCEIGPIPKGRMVENYEDKLWKEAPYIVGHCLNAYSKFSPGEIKVDDESFDDVTAVDSDSMQAVFDKHFYFHLDPSKPDGEQKFLTGSEMQHVLIYGAMMKKRADRSRFLTFLRKKYSCKSKTFRFKNTVLRGYLGMISKGFVFDRSGSNVSSLIRLVGENEQ